jgi:molybdopterin-guanine dinucleotide biosynthesis protein A
MGAMVLAAGAGRRMGHRPKCLLQLNGRSLIDRQLEAVFQADLVLSLSTCIRPLAQMTIGEPVTVFGDPEGRLCACDLGALCPESRNRTLGPDGRLRLKWFKS